MPCLPFLFPTDVRGKQGRKTSYKTQLTLESCRLKDGFARGAFGLESNVDDMLEIELNK